MTDTPDIVDTASLRAKARALLSRAHLSDNDKDRIRALLAATESTSTLRAENDALREALRPLAEERTVAELLFGRQKPEWFGCAPERRVELIAEHRKVRDTAILAARALLTQERG